MPKLPPRQALDELVSLIATHPHGIGLEALLEAQGGKIARRTLQRRLALLVRDGRIAREGVGRAIKYRLAPITGHLNSILEDDTLSATGEVYVPISPEGEAIKSDVRQSLQARRPVGYRNEFLEAYAPNRTYYLPGKIREQFRILGRVPTGEQAAGTFARDILNRLLIDLSWASSHLEGNTYSRLDTERLIEFGQVAEGKDALETQMILNHKAAIEYLVREADHIGITREALIALHAFLSDGLLPDPLDCGRLRRRAVEIAGSVFRPVALPQRIEELFGIVVTMAEEIQDPFEQAFFAMVHLPYLQPFEDVNKRVSRLAANIPFLRHNLCPLSFIDVPERAYVDALLGVYELNRVELLRDVFVWAYERSCQQYVAVQHQLVPPDTFRLRLRTALTEVIRAIVLGRIALSADAIQNIVPTSITDDDRPRFITLVISELTTLHAGNAIRFGIRPLEFETWRESQGQVPHGPS